MSVIVVTNLIFFFVTPGHTDSGLLCWFYYVIIWKKLKTWLFWHFILQLLSNLQEVGYQKVSVKFRTRAQLQSTNQNIHLKVTLFLKHLHHVFYAALHCPCKGWMLRLLPLLRGCLPCQRGLLQCCLRLCQPRGGGQVLLQAWNLLFKVLWSFLFVLMILCFYFAWVSKVIFECSDSAVCQVWWCITGLVRSFLATLVFFTFISRTLCKTLVLSLCRKTLF